MRPIWHSLFSDRSHWDRSMESSWIWVSADWKIHCFTDKKILFWRRS